jgi:alkylhydroperoxidase family enzyme
MPRLKQIGKDEAHPNAQAIYQMLFKGRDPVKEPGTDTGTPGNWWTVWAVSPDAFDHAVAGFQYYRGKRKLSPKLRELGQTRAGWGRGSQFVFSQHCKASRGVGLTEEQIQSIPHWQVADCYSPVERAVLAYTDGMVIQGGRVAEGIFTALKKHLSDEEIMELTYIVGMYDMHAMISKALRLEYDDVDDRIVEVAAPTGNTANNDVMRMVDTEKKTE